MTEKFSRNENDENGRVFYPSFVRVDEQIEEGLPMFGAATRKQRAPLLSLNEDGAQRAASNNRIKSSCEISAPTSPAATTGRSEPVQLDSLLFELHCL